MTDASVGQLVRAAREAAGLSKRQLSLAAGLSESYVGKVEAGHLNPTIGAFARIAESLNLNDREIVLIVKVEGARGR